MYKTVDNKPIPDSDNPSTEEVELLVDVFTLEEMLEFRLQNKPKGPISEKQWKRDVNDLVDEINSIVGFNKWSKVC